MKLTILLLLGLLITGEGWACSSVEDCCDSFYDVPKETLATCAVAFAIKDLEEAVRERG